MKKLLYLLFVPAVIWLMIITGFSGNNGESSSSLSMSITKDIADYINLKCDSAEEYNNTLEKMNFFVRKTAHMCEYAILFILIGTALYINIKYQFGAKLSIRKMWIITLGLCVLFASLDEIHQLFVDGRSGRLTDVCIDTTGACIGGLIFLTINKLSNHKIERKGK